MDKIFKVYFSEALHLLGCKCQVHCFSNDLTHCKVSEHIENLENLLCK